MIRLRGTVEYDGGRVEEFAAGSTVFVAWESYSRRHNLDPYDQRNTNTMTHFVAYTALGIAEGFDVWMRSVQDVDVEPGGSAVPPTVPEVSVEA